MLSMGGEQSLNPPSTPSRLNLTLLCPPPPLHHHSALALSSPDSPVDPATSTSPLLRDVGLTSAATAPSQARMQPWQPLPFSKGCGQLNLARWRMWRGRAAKGGPRKWEAHMVHHKRSMTNVIDRFLPLLPP